MNLVASEARHGGLVRQILSPQAPRTGVADRRDQFGNATLEVHAVATETIVHQLVCGVVLLVEENSRVAGAVRSRMPRGVLPAMTTRATFGHGLHVVIGESNSLRQIASHVRNKAHGIVPMKRRVQRERSSVAFLAGDASMTRGMPIVVHGLHFVAACAAASAARFVVEARARHQQDQGQDCRGRDKNGALHPRTFDPFQVCSRLFDAR